MQMKKWHYWVIGVLIGLIFTNPTMQDFKNYKGSEAQKLEIFDFSRDANFLIFSFYNDGFTREYVGICKNFLPIGNSGFRIYHLKKDSIGTDSTKMGSAKIDTTWGKYRVK